MQVKVFVAGVECPGSYERYLEDKDGVFAHLDCEWARPHTAHILKSHMGFNLLVPTLTHSRGHPRAQGGYRDGRERRSQIIQIGR